MPQGNRRTRTAVLALVGGGAVALGLGAAALLQGANGHGTIDGRAISEQDLAYATTEVRRTVESSGGDEDDLRDAAVQVLREDQALLDLARREGLTEYDGVSAILEDVTAVNAERRDAVEAGLPVYGPVQYSAEQLVGKTLTDLRSGLLERLRDRDDVAATDEEIAARFDADPSAWSADATTLSLTLVRSPEADANVTLATAAFEDAAALPGAETSSIVIAPNSPELATWNPRLVEELRASVPGTVIGPVPDRGGWSLLRLDDAVIDRDAALEAYDRPIRTVLAEEALDRLLAATVAAQHVELD